ncbi:MAG: hypothetical protein ACI9W6_002587 [Motiliproteus sp.]|jgi:hypothetical protein
MLARARRLLPIIGWLLLVAVLLSIAHGLGLVAAPWSGVFIWMAGGLLFARVSGILRIQVLVIGVIGVLTLGWGTQGQALPWSNILAVNHSLIAMLVAVSFLRLVTSFKVDSQERLPTGRLALCRTLLGVHLFGAVINMSTLVIIGERLARREPLSSLQGMLLSRGFATAALWSPFFVAMGVALTVADGAQLSTLVVAGIPAAAMALLFAAISLCRHPEADTMPGYPMHFEALWLPGLLALMVMTACWLWPGIVILTWVSSLSLLLCLGVLLGREGRPGLKRMRTHVERQLPQMGGEVCLFLAAGLLSLGLASLVQRSGFAWPLASFGPWQAWGLLLIITAAAMIGIHPLISITTSGGILLGQVDDPNLLGITYLMGWSLGVMASPVSGTHLSLQARFGLPAHRFFKLNLGFVLQMLLINLLVLQGYHWVAARLS